MTTPNIAMAELSTSQASKETTHNDALRILDALVHAGIQDKDLTTPPSHTHGYLWIVGAGATGAWASKDGKIAQSYNSAWYFLTPKEGWRVWANDENATYVYDGAAWVLQSTSGSNYWGGVAGGSANDITMTCSPTVSSYSAGLSIKFKTGASANTSTVTVAPDGLTAKAIKWSSDIALAAGDLPANKIHEIIYDSVSDIFHLL